MPARSTRCFASASRSSGAEGDFRQSVELSGQRHGLGLAKGTLPHDAGPGRPAARGREVISRLGDGLQRLSSERLGSFYAVQALGRVQRFPKIVPALGVQPEIAVLPNTRASISAVSAVTALRPWHSSLMCLRGSPVTFASRVCDKPGGSINSSNGLAFCHQHGVLLRSSGTCGRRCT